MHTFQPYPIDMLEWNPIQKVADEGIAIVAEADGNCQFLVGRDSVKREGRSCFVFPFIWEQKFGRCSNPTLGRKGSVREVGVYGSWLLAMGVLCGGEDLVT